MFKKLILLIIITYFIVFKAEGINSTPFKTQKTSSQKEKVILNVKDIGYTHKSVPIQLYDFKYRDL